MQCVGSNVSLLYPSRKSLKEQSLTGICRSQPLVHWPVGRLACWNCCPDNNCTISYPIVFKVKFDYCISSFRVMALEMVKIMPEMGHLHNIPFIHCIALWATVLITLVIAVVILGCTSGARP